MTPTLTPNNSYIGRTGTEPRPAAATWRGSNLEAQQAMWDAARDHAADNDRLRAKRLAIVAERERAARERAAAAGGTF